MMRPLFALLLACRSAAPPVTPPVQLTQVLAEAAGTACPAGGVAITTGSDADGDGQLMGDEVTTTSYICSGAPGVAGSMGATGGAVASSGAIPLAVLTQTFPEPKGPNCAYGGTRIEVGLDSNGDGIFDPDELNSVIFVCSEDPLAHVHVGTLVLQSAFDVDAAQHLTSVVGDVQVNLAVGMPVSLPNLAVVHGAITDCGAGGNLASSLILPQLGAVAGGIALGCSANLTTLQAPLLSYAGSLSLTTPALASIDLSSLQDVAGSVTIAGTALVPGAFATKLPKLTRVGGKLIIRDNPNLDDCGLIANVHARRLAGAHLDFEVGNNFCADVLQACPQLPVGSNPTEHRLCYYRQSWSQGTALCVSIGVEWQLTYVTGDAELALLSAATGLQTPGPAYWIGYSDAAVEGTFVWVQAPSGNTYAPQAGSGTFWAAGQPDDFGGAEDCADLRLAGGALKASDAACTAADRYPICRYLAP